MANPDLVYARPPEEEGSVITLVTKKGNGDPVLFQISRNQAWAIMDQLSINLRLSYERERNGF